jgi:folate-binding protein YgfZ
VRSLEVDQGSRNLLLTPKGRVLEEFELLRTGEHSFQLSTHPARAPILAEALDRFLFADQVELRDASEEHSPIDLCGPGAQSLLAGLFGEEPDPSPRRTGLHTFEGNALRVTSLPVLGTPGWRLDAGPRGVAALWRALVAAGARPIGHVAAERVRIEEGEATFGADVNEETYPQEARWENAFSLSKGCYPGQEVVAKIDTYGGLNRVLVGLRVEDDQRTEAGSKLRSAEGRELGRVTSWALSPRLGTGLCLAYVKVDAQEAGSQLFIEPGARAARVVSLPVGE